MPSRCPRPVVDDRYLNPATVDAELQNDDAVSRASRVGDELGHDQRDVIRPFSRVDAVQLTGQLSSYELPGSRRSRRVTPAVERSAMAHSSSSLADIGGRKPSGRPDVTPLPWAGKAKTRSVETDDPRSRISRGVHAHVRNDTFPLADDHIGQGTGTVTRTGPTQLSEEITMPNDTMPDDTTPSTPVANPNRTKL
jgi:hypothetical protein